MDWLLEQALLRPKRFVAVAVAVLLLIGAGLWWQFVWLSPRQVFVDMLANNLSTQSVTKLVSAGNQTQGVDQAVRLEMGSTNATDWLVAAKQSGSTVETESIGIPTTGFIRYVKITTPQKTASNKPFDFHTILNTWAKTDGKADASLAMLFSQTLLDITNAPTPPIANLSTSQRDELLDFIQREGVFTPDYAKVTHETVRGQSVYTYQVAVKLDAYVRMMQAFAHDLGLKSIDTVDPNQYVGFAPLAMTMSVNPVSHQLVRVLYASTGFSQEYADWGLFTPITLPGHTITTSELQHRLQALNPSNQ